ncbi:TIGR03621 family F420-dependent LLM class oxidoreductase [Amycolatopsis sp. 195334CR]|uniref:TIGR03621 family F420-dependent LLM class oxidoreductase n=1 Tax=Amycolatopsis sp. 195334CR TaxID=2814588 RepID=UPI001A8F1254|nr:TIGR03621 family F420-dependent LLM class oxidoreductase [Amycolatopsis sp. 195334CR]MBN6033739.1 TIGR03621 family F420-dependent LLM class oxidoreductase [Amycolatopsis sp. 195334CR]
MREFRFGVVAESVRDGAGLIETAKEAERLGYSTLLVRDHFVTEPFGDQLSPMLALTAVAAATTRLRVGTLVLSNDYRHPVLLAKEAATLQHLSGGRFELGIGAGWLLDEYERAGLPFDAAGVRVSRLGESLSVLDGLLSGEKLTYSGAHYRVRELSVFPSAGRPPLLVGAGGKRMLRLAGAVADTVGILPIALPGGSISDAMSERSAETMTRKVGWVRESGRDVELSQILSFDLADDHRAAAERTARSRGWGASAADFVLAMPSRVTGSATRIADELQSRRERYGLSYHVISDRDMHAFAPIAASLR